MSLSILIPLLTTFLGGFSAWLFTRRKQKAEAEKVELENVEKAIAIWRNIAETLSNKVDELNKRCEMLTQEIESMKKENKSLKFELKRFRENYQSKLDLQ